MSRAFGIRLALWAIAVLAVTFSCSRPMPDFSRVRARPTASDVRVLARDGTLLDEVRTEFRERRLAWTPLGEVSPAFLKALVETEDRRFAGHAGVDPWAMFGALRGFSASGRLRGASTITMQLTGLIDGTGRRGRRTLAAKLQQIRDAVALEKRWSKTEVLEAYVNLVPFRGELVGIRAASLELFDKGPSGLDAAEGALLAAMISRPNARDAALARRACATLKRLDAGDRCRSLPSYLARTRSGPAERRGVHLAPHAGRRWIKERGAARGDLATTLDASLQRVALEEVEGQLRELRSQSVRDAAVLVLDNATGAVLAYVGSSAATSSEPDVDGVVAKRQAGSVLKPFLYEWAFAERRLTPEALLDDSPLEVAVAGGIYQPKNYDKVFRGPVTARVALASSLNVPAVKVLDLVGVDSYWSRLRDLGFEVGDRADFFGPSLALGAVDVSLEEVARAYRDLARRAETEHSARAVADVLSDRVARAPTFGLESHLATRFYTAVKTGTSKDMRDNWCVGFSGRYTVAVWVGNFDGQPMWNVSGVTGAAPIWMKLMKLLHRETPSPLPRLPLASAEAASLIEDPAVLARITYPPDGLVVAWDPDLPEERQAILPAVWPEDAVATLELDGRPWPRGKPLTLRDFARGRHELALKGPGAVELDRVGFRF